MLCATVDAVGASIETPVEVTCNRSIDLPDDDVVKTAAVPWIARLDSISFITQRLEGSLPDVRFMFRCDSLPE